MKKLILSSLAIALLATACKKDDPVSNSSNSNPENNSTELSNQLKNYAPEPQKKLMNSEEVIIFKTNQENEIAFPANAFVDASGNAVTGYVDISVTEITNISDMILSGMYTNSDQGPLSSQGEFNIEVTQNGQTLSLADGVSFNIENPNVDIDSAITGWSWNPDLNSNGTESETSGEWTQNENESNNPCDRFIELRRKLYVDPTINTPQYWEDLQAFKDEIYIHSKDQFDFSDRKVLILNSSDNQNSSAVAFHCYNDMWTFNPNNFVGVGDIHGITDSIYPYSWAPYADSSDVFIGTGSGCSFGVTLDSNQTTWYDLDPNKISISFTELSWCNIDKLLWEYGQLNNCKLGKGIPDNAIVSCVFKEFNGAVPCKLKDGQFVADRLPDGLDVLFMIYFKDGDKYKCGTQTITAANEMVFDESNLKTVDDIDALVEEIKKIIE